MLRLQRLVWFSAALVCTAMLAAPPSAQTLKSTGMPLMENRVLPIAKPQVKPLPPGPGGPAPQAGALPDLRVGVIKISPQYPGEGQTVRFEGNIMNYGAGPAPNPVVTLTVTGPSGVSFPLYRKQFDVTLGRNQGVTLVQQFKVPRFGGYSCTFTLDPAGMIAETDDANNMKELTFNVDALPDLVVCISNGKRPPVGGEREIRVVVKNIGNGNCSNFMKLQFHVEGKGTETYELLPINAGDSRERTRKCKWSTSGTKTIAAKVIYSGRETDKHNNQVQGSFFVRLPHHDKYSSAPKVKCSNNRSFYDWEQCNGMH